MSYSEQFVMMNNLQPADAILLKKKFFGMVNHFAVYLGRHSVTNRPLFAANYTKGIQILTDSEVNHFLQTLEPEKIDRFYGSGSQRRNAVKRAMSQVGKSSYNLIFNNCEHYKNFVQYGKKYSNQVKTAGNAAMLGGGITAIAGIAKGSKTTLGVGLFSFALGAIASLGGGKK